MAAKPTLARLVTRAQLVRLHGVWRRARKHVVFTNGVFDILHRGHIEMLDEAKSLGDVLVVGLNSDASVRRLKGPSRPINYQRDRAIVLLALRSVDFVCVFAEDTPYELIGALKPDVLVKGAEYGHRAIVGADLVESWGGETHRIRMRKGYSSTTTIGRMRPRKYR